VHRILFEGLYLWAGKDLAEILPNSAVKKGALYFCHPRDCRLAVSEGLSVAQDNQQMSKDADITANFCFSTLKNHYV